MPFDVTPNFEQYVEGLDKPGARVSGSHCWIQTAKGTGNLPFILRNASLCTCLSTWRQTSNSMPKDLTSHAQEWAGVIAGFKQQRAPGTFPSSFGTPASAHVFRRDAKLRTVCRRTWQAMHKSERESLLDSNSKGHRQERNERHAAWSPPSVSHCSDRVLCAQSVVSSTWTPPLKVKVEP